MGWKKLHFGKHAGKTLPQVAVVDPGYVAWGVENDVFTSRLAAEASEVLYRLSRIRPPASDGERLWVEAVWDCRGRFERLSLVTAANRYRGNCHVGAWRRLDLLTPWAPRRELKRARTAATKLLRQIYGGGRWTETKANDFFSTDAHFILPADHEPAPQRYDDGLADQAYRRGGRKDKRRP